MDTVFFYKNIIDKKNKFDIITNSFNKFRLEMSTKFTHNTLRLRRMEMRR